MVTASGYQSLQEDASLQWDQTVIQTIEDGLSWPEELLYMKESVEKILMGRWRVMVGIIDGTQVSTLGGGLTWLVQ